MTYKISNLTGWGKYPVQSCKIVRPEQYEHLPIQSTTIARGQGRSYGDASLNAHGQVLLTERLNKFIAFDKIKGTLTAEAGITLAEILDIIVPHGWFLPVVPGTKFVSLGGCIAADIHGKNHHHVGSFCQHVIGLDLINANNETITCSPTKNADFFWATVGGMGLTGVIGNATIKLTPITTAYLTVQHYPTDNLEQTFYYLNQPRCDDEYVVAWLDCLSGNSGRSIIMSAHHAKLEEILNPAPLKITQRKSIKIPLNCPSWFLNKKALQKFNQFYYSLQAKKIEPFLIDYDKYFFQLDALINWNRLYGKKGFIQYQCVLPPEQAFNGIKEILAMIAKEAIPVFLAVLKRFGETQQGLLSFPMAGYTVALDIPLQDNKLFQQLDLLDEIVLKHAGRVYLAKDARLSAENFRKMYPHYPQWLTQKNILDTDHVFSSSLSQRLKIGF